jgi:chitinase
MQLFPTKLSLLIQAVRQLSACILLGGATISTQANTSVYEVYGDHSKGTFLVNAFTPAPPPVDSSRPAAAPDILNLTLEGLGIVQLNIKDRSSSYNRRVLQGTLMQHGTEIEFSEVTLVETEQKNLMGSIETLQGKWLLMPNFEDNQQVLIKRHNQLIEDEALIPELHPAPHLHGISGMAPTAQAAPDQDSNGNTIIDIFMGFSTKALPYVQDKDAWAVMQVATVNNALKNSEIENIQVRLVGTGITDNHQGMDWHQLNDLEDWFAADIAATSPDVVVGYMKSESGFERQAGGWAFVGGTTNINSIDSPNAFRHELGHNMGGSHCHDQNGYNFGFNNGMTKTQMCGNNINYYSNPELTDIYGLPIGDAQTANMARIWRENAAKKSSNRPALLPFQDESQNVLLEKQHIRISKGSWDHTTLDISNDTQRLVVTVNDGSASFKDSVELFAKYNSQPTSTNFDFSSLFNAGNNSIGINNPKSGPLVIGLNATTDVKDLTLTVYTYGSATGDSDSTNNPAEGDKLSTLISPLSETVLGEQTTFEYSEGNYLWLFMGSKKGAADIFDGKANGTSTQVSNIPQDGRTVYISLWTYIDDVWYSNEYEFISHVDSTDSNTDNQSGTETGSSTGNQTGSDSNTDNQTDSGTGSETDSNTDNNEQSSNRAPVIRVTAPQQATAFSIFTIDASETSDLDNDDLVYIWFQIAGPSLTIEDRSAVSAKVHVNNIQTDAKATFKLTVFDGEVTATQEVSVMLKATDSTSQSSNDANNNEETDGMDNNADAMQSGSLGFIMLTLMGLIFRRRA